MDKTKNLVKQKYFAADYEDCKCIKIKLIQTMICH